MKLMINKQVSTAIFMRMTGAGITEEARANSQSFQMLTLKLPMKSIRPDLSSIRRKGNFFGASIKCESLSGAIEAVITLSLVPVLNLTPSNSITYSPFIQCVPSVRTKNAEWPLGCRLNPLPTVVDFGPQRLILIGFVFSEFWEKILKLPINCRVARLVSTNLIGVTPG